MNQYRCETCDFKGAGMMGDKRCPYDVQKTNEDNCDLLYRYKRTSEEKELMNLCGLTCHSEFQSGCDKVLDKILKDISGDNPDVTDCDTTDEWYGHGWDDCRDHITKYITDLRQGGKS